MKKRLYLAALTAALTLGAAANRLCRSMGYRIQMAGGTRRMTEAGLPTPGNGLMEIRMEWRECYYFGPNGYIYTSTTTPDGYTVDENGAWTVNGTVQTQTTSGNTFGGSSQYPRRRNSIGGR